MSAAARWAPPVGIGGQSGVESMSRRVCVASCSGVVALAFCESSGRCLVRRSGNDGELVELATRAALAIGAGHSFVVFLREGVPINELNQL